MWQQFKALNISTFRWNIHTAVFKIRKQKILQGKLMTIWYDLALVTGSRLLFEVRQAGFSVLLRLTKIWLSDKVVA